MLTRSGWASLGIGVILGIVARVVGPSELWVLSAGAIALPLLALAWVHLRRPNVQAVREVGPTRIFAGSSSRIQITFGNDGRISSPVLAITDRLGDGRDANLQLPPIRSGSRTAAGYRLPAERRGVVSIGPLDFSHTDPFGMAARRWSVIDPIDVLVYPRYVEVPPPPRPPGDDQRLDEQKANHLGRSSNEFYALRNYVVGDDLRRVHWPSTARFGEPMIRQDEQPEQGRTTVLLDNRAEAAVPAVFERMVSAATSLLFAARNRDDLVRLVTTSGYDSGFTTSVGRDEALDELARVQQVDRADLLGTISLLQRSMGTSVVAVLGQAKATPNDVQAVPAASLVVFGSDPSSQPIDVGLASNLMVAVSPSQDFSQQWTAAVIGAKGRTRR